MTHCYLFDVGPKIKKFTFLLTKAFLLLLASSCKRLMIVDNTIYDDSARSFLQFLLHQLPAEHHVLLSICGISGVIGS